MPWRTRSGSRGSSRQRARRSAMPSRRSISASTRTPASEVSRPPSKATCTGLPAIVGEPDRTKAPSATAAAGPSVCRHGPDRDRMRPRGERTRTGDARWTSRPGCAGLGLEQYDQAFRDNAIDAEVLPRLTADDLKELGSCRSATGASCSRRSRRWPRRDDARAAAATPRARGRAAAGDGRSSPTSPATPRSAASSTRRRCTRSSSASSPAPTASSPSIGGRVDKHIGDCVMAVFGAPVAHGNDAERAVRAALAIRDAMPDRRPRRRAGARGARRRRRRRGGGQRHRQRGAPRVHRHRRDGEPGLAADRRRAGRARSWSRTRCGGPWATGWTATTPARSRSRASPTRCGRGACTACARPGLDRRPLVGRRGRAGPAPRGPRGLPRGRVRGRAVHVRGEAGIGKTRLVEELRQDGRARPASPATPGWCSTSGGTGRDASGRSSAACSAWPSDGAADATRAAARAGAGRRPRGRGAAGVPQRPARPAAAGGAAVPLRGHGQRGPRPRQARDRGRPGASGRAPARPLLARRRGPALGGRRHARGPRGRWPRRCADCPAILVTTSRPQGDPLDQGGAPRPAAPAADRSTSGRCAGRRRWPWPAPPRRSGGPVRPRLRRAGRGQPALPRAAAARRRGGRDDRRPGLGAEPRPGPAWTG